MDVRAVKEKALRAFAEMRVGSNPTPCTSELSNDTSEVRSRLSTRGRSKNRVSAYSHIPLALLADSRVLPEATELRLKKKRSDQLICPSRKNGLDLLSCGCVLLGDGWRAVGCCRTFHSAGV